MRQFLCAKAQRVQQYSKKHGGVDGLSNSIDLRD